MFKSIYCICLILSLTLILTACTEKEAMQIIDALPFSTGDAEVDQAVATGKPGECEKIKDEKDSVELARKNNCYRQMALTNRDSNLCKNIVGEKDKIDKCYYELAEEKGEIALCEQIANQTDKRHCLVRVAVSKGDESLCAESWSTTDQKECFTGVAVKKGDSSVCDGLTNMVNKTQCYLSVAEETSQVEVCKKMDFANVYKRQFCVDNVAMQTGNAEDCEAHYDAESELDCLKNIASETGDMNICDDMNDEEDKADCIAAIAIEKNDENMCAKANDNYERNSCYSAIAENKQSLEICDKIDDERDMSNCYVRVVEKTGDLKNCRSVNVQVNAQENCIMKASIRGDDALICKDLDESKQYKCAFNVAIYQRDASHCGRGIVSQGTREKCIFEVVKRYQDPKLCEQITDPGDKNKCEEDLKFVN